MKSLALFALSAVATAVMATQPAPDPQITINGASTQIVNVGGAMVTNRADQDTEAFQNLASNSGNVTINGHSLQAVNAGPFAMIRNAAEGEDAYALQALASNVGDVTVNGWSMQLVSVGFGVVSNEADGRDSKAVQNLASNNACFTCEAPRKGSHGHGGHGGWYGN